MNRASRRAATRNKERRAPAALEQDLRDAIRDHRVGKFHEAEARYRNILRSMPQNATALHFLGVLRHQQGRPDEGVELVRRALALAPTYVDAWSNLGNVYKESGRMDDAAAAYRQALSLSEEHSAAWNNLGVVLRARGEPAPAVEALRRAIDLAPDFADAYYNLGNALRECGRLAEAVAAYRQALSLDSSHARAHYRLGYALYMSGARAEATQVFRRWLDVEPGNPIPGHMLAAFSGENVPDRASDDYVRVTFDGFAASFDDVLVHRLGYQAPKAVLDALAPVLGAPQTAYDILDAGCGTGLCGPLLKPYARSLTGVDLSTGMLARARARETYDRLCADEITRFLAGNRRSFDVIVFVDTLCYFGELNRLAQMAHGALRAGGWIAFTVERSDDVDAYRMEPHGRYSHARAYVDRLLASAGFEDIESAPVVLRRELGAPVQGWVVRARARDDCGAARACAPPHARG